MSDGNFKKKNTPPIATSPGWNPGQRATSKSSILSSAMEFYVPSSAMKYIAKSASNYRITLQNLHMLEVNMIFSKLSKKLNLKYVSRLDSSIAMRWMFRPF